MIRIAIITASALLSMLALSVAAQTPGFMQPMLPYGVDVNGTIGPIIPGSGPMVPTDGLGASPPAGCNGAIDLSTGCVVPGLGG